MGLALLLAGCGQRPVAVPQVITPAAPQGFHQLIYRTAGIGLSAPRSWVTTPETAPLVAVISSDGAVISLWRYPGAFPATSASIHHAYRRLIATALHRQPKLHILSSGVAVVDGHPAVELDASERIGTTQQRVRSLHVFTPAAEVVLEEYAPPNLFDRVNRQVFEHVSRSLVLLGP